MKVAKAMIDKSRELSPRELTPGEVVLAISDNKEQHNTKYLRLVTSDGVYSLRTGGFTASKHGNTAMYYRFKKAVL